MRRIVFIPGGVWQLLVTVSAMKQADRGRPAGTHDDTLVIFSLQDNPVGSEMIGAMDRAARAAWSWRDVRRVDDLDYGQMDWNPLVEAIRDRLGDIGDADELWLGSLWGRFEKAIAEAFPSAKIVLYEDGLHTYVSAGDCYLTASDCLTHPRRSWQLLKRRLRERLRPYDRSVSTILHRHLLRVSNAYLFIGRFLPMPDYLRPVRRLLIETSLMKETIAEVGKVATEPQFALDENSRPLIAVALGQCFSNYGDLDRGTELAGYVEMARKLHGDGFTVLWKEHPRTREPFYDEIALAVEGVYQVPGLSPWPIELFAERLGISRCVSVTSTSLFTFPLLFGVPAFTIADRFLATLRHPNDTMARLAIAHAGHL